MLVLYKALDEFHVEARPDYFVHRDEVYPREHYNAAIVDPECLLMGAFIRTKRSSVSSVPPCGRRAEWSRR